VAILQLDPMFEKDIEEVVLRDWEALEYRGDYKEALRHRLMESEEAFSVRIDGKLCLLFGHFSRSLYKGSGIVWMVATPAAENNWIQMVKFSKFVVMKLNLIYPQVFTATYPKNARAIRFLEWLGFKKYSMLNDNLTMVRG